MLPKHLPRKISLLGLHTFSGCDSCGIGKRNLLNIVKGNEEYCNTLSLLEEGLQIEDHLFDMLEIVLWQAYGFLNKANDKEVRYEKYCREKFLETFEIPPAKDELHQHIKCVNYQVFTWLEANQQIPVAYQNDLGGIDGTYNVHWVDN